MTTEIKALKGASWLAAFKFVSQAFSWVATILVARMLLPADYGLMAMATIITGYAMLFSELGLGGAIIQRSEPTSQELSSVFWFALGVSLFFGLSCLVIAYPTAWLFNEPRVIPITQVVSGLFVIAGLQVVPLNLLKKEMRFKEVGRIEATGVVVSCLFMLVAAYWGAGVWTLIGGNLVKTFVCLLLVYRAHTWRPAMSFEFRDALSYLKFGVPLALGTSVGYVNNKSDTFFAGRLWMPDLLGFYTFAKQLSRIPNDKIVSLVYQVTFSAFASLQNEPERFNCFYLNVVKMVSSLVFPLFVGGFLLGDELVRLLFDEKWYPMIFIFKFMCLAEVVTPLAAVNSYVHGAQGRPKWFLAFNLVMVVFMPLSFFLAAPHGLHAMVIPWFTTYLTISTLWIYISIRKIGISFVSYLLNLSVPIAATLLMSAVVWWYRQLRTSSISLVGLEGLPDLAGLIILGGGTYVLYFLIFDWNTLCRFKALLNKKH